MIAKPRSDVSLGFFVVVLVAALYVPGLSGPFIFDDGPALTKNPYLQTMDATQIDDWRIASLSSDSGPLRRPVAMLTFSLNQSLSGGINALPIKALNLIIHLLVGLQVYLLAVPLLRLSKPAIPRANLSQVALLAAALWLLAPLHVSTVLYSVQRMAQLATVFVLAGLIVFIYWRERWSKQGATQGELLSVSLWLLLILLLAVLSKENGILLLWLLVVVEVTLFRGRWNGVDVLWLRYLGWLAFIAPLMLIAYVLIVSPQVLLGGYAGRDFSVEERVLTQMRLLWQYLSWLVLPNIDAMGFQHDDIVLSSSWKDPLSTFFAAVCWLLTLVTSLLVLKRLPLFSFSLLFYLTAHTLESGLWPLEMVYEHRNYLPSVGVFILVAYTLFWASSSQSFLRPRLLATLVLTVVSTLLFLRVHIWAEPHRLSAVNVENHPNSSRSHAFLAESYLQAFAEGKIDKIDRETRLGYLFLARHHFERMHQLKQDDMAALVMLYYMDSYYFPDIEPRYDWLGLLQKVSVDRPLQWSDFTALETLTDCFINELCGSSPEPLFTLLNTLESRYPQNTKLVLMRYRYLEASKASTVERFNLLDRAFAIQSSDTVIYQHQVAEYAAQGDFTGVFEAILNWLREDPNRHDLGLIKAMFEPTSEGSNQGVPSSNTSTEN